MDLTPYLDQAQSEAELFALLRIPSISAQSEYAPQMQEAAEFLHYKLQSLGFQSRIDATAGCPVVFAHYLVSAELPTVLVYGHYDVQPADEDPQDPWITPPFEPTIRDGRLYARGATDDKGQVYAYVRAIEALQKATGTLPVNIKFLIEGEEEIGSKHLGAYVADHIEDLQCDVISISDGSRYGPEIPSITYALRGLSYIEVHVQGAARDLHSGTYGGAAPNPINALTQILAQLQDTDGRVTIPGFYDDVIPLTQTERDMWASLPHQDSAWQEAIGATALIGETGYNTLEKVWGRPTLDINGIWGGYQGEGAKTVIAARAAAKVSMRLVPGQDAKHIANIARAHIESLAPAGYTVTTIEHHGCQPVVSIELNSPYIQAASDALKQVFGQAPCYIRAGGSIGVVADFRQRLGVPVLLLDFGLNEDALHAPNESFTVRDYHRAILTCAYFFQNVAQLPR